MAAGHRLGPIPSWTIFNIDTCSDADCTKIINSQEILLPNRGINAVVLDDRLNVVNLSELQISRQYLSDDKEDKENLDNKIITIRTIALDNEYLNSNKYYSIDESKDQLLRKRDYKLGITKDTMDKISGDKNVRLIDVLEHPKSYYKFKVKIVNNDKEPSSEHHNKVSLEAINKDGLSFSPRLYLKKHGDNLILGTPNNDKSNRLFKIMSSYDAFNVKLNHEIDIFNSKGINDKYNHDGLVTFESNNGPSKYTELFFKNIFESSSRK